MKQKRNRHHMYIISGLVIIFFTILISFYGISQSKSRSGSDCTTSLNILSFPDDLPIDGQFTGFDGTSGILDLYNSDSPRESSRFFIRLAASFEDIEISPLTYMMPPYLSHYFSIWSEDFMIASYEGIIYRIDRATAVQEQLTPEHIRVGYISRVLPNGYVVFRGSNKQTDQWGIYSVSVNGGNTILLDNREVGATHSAFRGYYSSDGNYLYYLRYMENNELGIHRVRVAGGTPELVRDGWLPQGEGALMTSVLEDALIFPQVETEQRDDYVYMSLSDGRSKLISLLPPGRDSNVIFSVARPTPDNRGLVYFVGDDLYFYNLETEEIHFLTHYNGDVPWIFMLWDGTTTLNLGISTPIERISVPGGFVLLDEFYRPQDVVTDRSDGLLFRVTEIEGQYIMTMMTAAGEQREIILPISDTWGMDIQLYGDNDIILYADARIYRLDRTTGEALPLFCDETVIEGLLIHIDHQNGAILYKNDNNLYHLILPQGD